MLIQMLCHKKQVCRKSFILKHINKKYAILKRKPHTVESVEVWNFSILFLLNYHVSHFAFLKNLAILRPFICCFMLAKSVNPASMEALYTKNTAKGDSTIVDSHIPI